MTTATATVLDPRDPDDLRTLRLESVKKGVGMMVAGAREAGTGHGLEGGDDEALEARGVVRSRVIATEACRLAVNGAEFVERVRAADSADEAATRRDVHALREEVRALRQEMAQVRDALRSPVDRAARKGAPDRQDS